MSRLGLIGFLLLTLIGGCHPLSCFFPPPLSPDEPIQIQTEASTKILVDKWGVPHIYAESINDLAFGFGFMHARDRQCQLNLFRHLAYGRLSEWYGDRAKEIDEKLKILSFKLDEQYQNLSATDRAILQTYAAGVNAGVRHAGQCAEQALMRHEFEPFLPQHGLAIARLQAWDLAVDLSSELLRATLFSKLPTNSPLRQAIQKPVSDSGVSIISERNAATYPSLAPAREREIFARKNRERAFPPFPTNFGASNAWAVHANKTKNGNAILCNDPHLRHSAPSIMYMAHLEHPDFTIAGASVPGIPAILIGHGRYIGWGLTAANVDTQDIVENSNEGPILPEAYQSNGRKLSVVWPGFMPIAANEHLISSFWDLGRAQSYEQASFAVARMGAVGVSVVLAFADGSIGYRLAALPRQADGNYLDPINLPSLKNPSEGYIVSANQRIVATSHPFDSLQGKTAHLPYRAKRIHQRLTNLLGQGSSAVTPNSLADIQQDILSLEAKELVPILAKYCDGELCEALKLFDGIYTPDSRGALVFAKIYRQFRIAALEHEICPDGCDDEEDELIDEISRTSFVKAALIDAMQALPMKELVSKACEKASKELAGDKRYGDFHTLQAGTPLARIPILGSLFKTPNTIESGTDATIRSERGLPIEQGAVLRFVVEMSDPPQAQFILDTGNSGHPGHPHFADQKPLWHDGKFLPLLTNRNEIERNLEGSIETTKIRTE